jgi:hypothetical protein
MDTDLPTSDDEAPRVSPIALATSDIPFLRADLEGTIETDEDPSFELEEMLVTPGDESGLLHDLLQGNAPEPSGIASRTRRRQAALAAEKTASAIRHLRDQAKHNGLQLLESGEFIPKSNAVYWESMIQGWNPTQAKESPKRRRTSLKGEYETRGPNEGTERAYPCTRKNTARTAHVVGIESNFPAPKRERFDECRLLRARELNGYPISPLLQQWSWDRHIPNSRGIPLLHYASTGLTFSLCIV